MQSIARIMLAALMCLVANGGMAQAAGEDHASSLAALEEALAAPSRPQADRERDAARKPAQVIRFLGIEQGMTAIDLIAAGGYYTEVLSITTGPAGTVYAQNPAFVLQMRDGAPDKALTARLMGGRLANVKRWDRELDDLGIAPGTVDVVITALNFHDYYNRSPEAAAELLSATLAVLKPGGVLGIIDHAGQAGADNAELHRIEEQKAIDAALAAGFELEAVGDMLRNPDDDHTKGVFDPAIRGKTDRFVLKLRKPA